MSLANHDLIALIIGIVLLDFAVQVAHVSNMNAIYQVRPDARSRMNSGYMVSYFIGGMLGSVSSTYLFSHFGWHAIVIAGLVLAFCALLIWFYDLKRNSERHPC